ncbi:MAG: hypothetical protein J3K34DRAFT_444357 [Monoraphidium minutum]|nr:MAG: hypothetical protein J3K34DRAFT_444357 [Monoraphidium minutum]
MHMLHTKVKLHGLEDNMLLGHRLDAMEWTGGDDDGHWVCGVTRVSDGAQLQVCARILFMATGKHAHPRAPAFPSDGSVQVLHSSELRDFETVRGRRVAVVGAGPSGLDILENSIKAGAKGQLEWIVRSPRHFFGVDLNKLAFVVPLQLLLGRWLSTVVMNAVMNLVMYARHALSGTLSWLPASPLNMRYEHPAPGRGFLLTQRRRVSRHVGKGAEVARVEGGAVVLKSGASVAVDMLVLATGYDLPTRPTGFQHPTNFAGCIPTGWHVGRMCLPAEGLLDSTGSAPMTAYLMYNTLRVMVKDPALLAHPPAHGMAAVGPCGRQQLFNCMEPLIHMAPLMRRELPFLTWRLRMAAVYLYYRVVHRTTVFFTDSLVWTGLNLDDLPRARGVGGGGGAAAAAAGGVKGGAGTGM